MILTAITLFVLAYLVCGVLAYGLTLGQFTANWPYMPHVRTALSLSLLGPVSLLVAILCGPLRFRLKPLSTEERWQIFAEEYPALTDAGTDRSWFER